MLAPVRTVAPTLDLWTLDEIKQHLREDSADNDAVLRLYLDAVTEYLDGWNGVLGRCLLTQTWRQDLGNFPSESKIRLPLMPVSSITSITYRDSADVSQTLSTSVYAGPFHDGLGAYVILKSNQTWPSTYEREDAVAITFAVGYASAAAVPKPIRQAALLTIADWCEHRESVAVGAAAQKIPITAAADALLAPFRRITP